MGDEKEHLDIEKTEPVVEQPKDAEQPKEAEADAPAPVEAKEEDPKVA